MTELIDLRTKQKILAFDKWMKGDHVMVHLDSRCSGVEVPEFLFNQPSLTLKLSYHFQGEVKRDDNAISAYLRFSGTYHKCVIPWTAVWGMTSIEGENSIWAEDMPKEVLLKAGHDKLRELGKKLFNFAGKEQSSNSTPSEENTKPSSPEDNKQSGAPKKTSGHLKRIK